jgi:DNA-binding transcriptional MerR regulator
MKTGEAAKRLGVSNKTILNWTERFENFMSENAKPGAGLQRDFNTDDLNVLNTVMVESTHGTSWDRIEKLLAAGTRNTELPPETSVLAGESAIMVSQQLTVLKMERDQLAERLAESNAEKKEAAATIRELEREIGRRDMKIETLEEEIAKLKNGK